MRFRPDERPLRNPLVKRPRRACKEYEFRLGVLPTPVRIRMNVGVPGEFSFETSHLLQTPGQALPYRTSLTSATTEAEALQLAVDSLTRFYTEAVERGHRPDVNWLVANDDYGWRP